MPKRYPQRAVNPQAWACLPQFTVIAFTMLVANSKTPAAGAPSAEPIVELKLIGRLPARRKAQTPQLLPVFEVCLRSGRGLLLADRQPVAAGTKH